MDDLDWIGSESVKQKHLIHSFSRKIEQEGIGYLIGLTSDLFGSSPTFWWNDAEVLKTVTWIGYVNIGAKACLRELSTTRSIKLKSLAYF